jgi:hypothetical protein
MKINKMRKDDKIVIETKKISILKTGEKLPKRYS